MDDYHPISPELSLDGRFVMPKINIVLKKRGHYLNGYKVSSFKFRFFKDKDISSIWCHYCGSSLSVGASTLDHKVPLSKGGSKSFENVVVACRKCNNEKADSSYEDFYKKKIRERFHWESSSNGKIA